jgi:hypothetical protein
MEVFDDLDCVDPQTDAVTARTVSLPGAGFNQDKTKEQAICRLVKLGVVGDYTIRGDAFKITVAPFDRQRVRNALLDYVERSQSGRSVAIEAELDEDPQPKVRDTVEQCVSLLVGFIYETVEQSRRRSLREMWLAARESADGEVLRQRILDFLNEGDLAPVLADLLQSAAFDITDWQAALSEIGDSENAEQWRGLTGHELESDPNHTGLLLGRGISELLVAAPNSFEAERNLRSALEGAPQRFGIDVPEVEAIAVWLCRWAWNRHPIAAMTVYGAVSSAASGGAQLDAPLDDLLERATSTWPFDPGLAVLAMTSRLEDETFRVTQLVNSFTWRWL